jgi:PAS domain S-box-containing protein
VQAKLNETSFFRRAVLQLFLGSGGLILLTFICFRAGLNVPTVGFVYLILVALLCVMGSFVVSVVLSLVAIACLNYFFAPPLYTLRVDAPEDIVAIFAFLTTSIIITSLTARMRRTAERAQASNKALVDTIPAMIWIAAPDGSRDFNSQRWLDFTGLSAREATGKSWAATLYAEDRPAVMEKWQLAVTTGKPFEVEARARGVNGQYRWFLVRAEPLRDERGTIVNWYGTSTDIEERKRAIEALRESEEQWREVFEHNPVMYFMIDPAGTVLSVNTFGAAQLGYPVNELIGQSVLNVFFEEDRAAVQQNVAVCLETLGVSHGWEIRKARKDGTVLWVRENAKAVRWSDKQLIVRKGWLNINETVEEIISLTRQEVRKNHVWLKTQLSDDVPLILADRIQLQQVILNLMINAVEALTAVPDAERVLQINTTACPSGDVSLTVRDSGPGLDQEKLEEVFGAFYTTKPDGMGMGLAVSRSIIEAHGGSLWANKNEPRGAIFQFTLPKDQGENL